MTPSVDVVIGYRPSGELDRERALAAIVAHYEAWGMAGIRLIDPPGEEYSRAGAFNAGAAESPADVLVLSNSDVLTSHHALSAAVYAAWSSRATVYPFTAYRELTEAATQRWFDEHEEFSGQEYDAQLVMGEECVGPLLVIRRDRYHEAGGMDARFRGWGFEDIAWSATSQTLLGPHLRVPGEVIHLYHEPMIHSWARPTPLYYENRALCKRYTEASGDADAIRALVAER